MNFILCYQFNDSRNISWSKKQKQMIIKFNLIPFDTPAMHSNSIQKATISKKDSQDLVASCKRYRDAFDVEVILASNVTNEREVFLTTDQSQSRKLVSYP